MCFFSTHSNYMIFASLPVFGYPSELHYLFQNSHVFHIVVVSDCSYCLTAYIRRRVLEFSIYTISMGIGVAQSVLRPAHGPDNQGSIPGRGNDEIPSPRHSLQTVSGAPPTVTESSYPGGKAVGPRSRPPIPIPCRGQKCVDPRLNSRNTSYGRGT
jgi:hypothetical protein